MRLLTGGLALLLLGCAGIEGEIKRAEIRESFLNVVQGVDRGAGNYNATIEKSIIRSTDAAAAPKLVRGRYQYMPPAYLSQWMIGRSVRGLGGTKVPDSDYLAYIVDRLFFVLDLDPTGAVRSLACEQLGRILVRLPLEGAERPPPDGKADQRINEIAQDLIKYGAQIRKGKKVKVGAVLERMDALARERPPTFMSARQMVRALAAQPVGGSSSPNVRARSEEIAPDIVRDAILVALAEAACGHPFQIEFPEDPSPLVRESALDVLIRVGSPVAKRAAIGRLSDPMDPAEREPDVRRKLVAYLGTLPGPDTFAACVVRLDDADFGVRYRAQEALVRLTGAQVAPTAGAWRDWREKRPEWQLRPAAK